MVHLESAIHIERKVPREEVLTIITPAEEALCQIAQREAIPHMMVLREEAQLTTAIHMILLLSIIHNHLLVAIIIQDSLQHLYSYAQLIFKLMATDS